MALPKEAVLEFQQIYKDVFHKDISYEEAVKHAEDCFLPHKAVYQPIRKEWPEEWKKKYKKEGGEKNE